MNAAACRESKEARAARKAAHRFGKWYDRRQKRAHRFLKSGYGRAFGIMLCGLVGAIGGATVADVPGALIGAAVLISISLWVGRASA